MGTSKYKGNGYLGEEKVSNEDYLRNTLFKSHVSKEDGEKFKQKIFNQISSTVNFKEPIRVRRIKDIKAFSQVVK